MEYTFKPQGVCSSLIRFEINDGKISNLFFTGGCQGNLKAVSKLVEGKDAKEISQLLGGNTCGYKNTSCADQLSIAINKALEESEE